MKSKDKHTFSVNAAIGIAALCLCLLPLVPVRAQNDSLGQYLEIAAKNNPAVLQRYYEYRAALQKVPQVGSLPDPDLSIGLFLSPMELVGGNQVADIRLMQMFPWFGVLKNAKDEMGLMAKARYETFRDAKLQLFYDVQSTWYDLYRLQQNIRTSEENLEILNTLQRLLLARYKAAPLGGSAPAAAAGSMADSNAQAASAGQPGMTTMGGGGANNAVPSQSGPTAAMPGSSMNAAQGGAGLTDLYQIQIEIGELYNTVASLRDQLNTATAQFNALLNRPAATTLAMPDTLKAEPLATSPAAVADTMLANSPMLGMLQYEAQSLDARLKMVSRMGYPMVGVGLNYSLINKNEMSTSAMNGKDMVMPMVTVTLPIYRNKYKSMKTEADLMKSATQQNYAATANLLQTEYYRAVQRYDDAARRIKLYDNQCALAKQTQEILVKSFSASGSGLSDVLRVRRQTLDYQFKQTEAWVDYLTAIARLKQLMGNAPIN